MYKIVAVFVAVLVLAGSAWAKDSGVTEQFEFTTVDRIKISTVSGDVLIRQGDSEKGSVTLSYNVTPKNCFRGEFKQRRNSLRIDEYWTTGMGEVQWLISLPKGMAMPEFDFSSASGSIELEGVNPADGSYFQTASGNVTLNIGAFPVGDLKAESASGTVRLKVDRIADNFTMRLIRRPDHGEISCPLAISSRDSYTENQLYERSLIKHGSGEPVITLKTASGRVIVDIDKATE